MCRIIASWAVWALVALPAAAQAQSWVESVLPERSFDAGSVARGSKVRHTFRLVNRLDREVRIASWKTKCGCTDVRVGSKVIPPGTQTTIEAVIDTTKFLGYKPSGLTLVFEQPGYAEVDLNLTCFIRGDVMLNPGVVDFGIVPRSSATRPTVTCTLNYSGGQANWGVVKMQTRTARVSAKLHESSRSAGGHVQYVLTATLDPSGDAGFFKDEITMVTNDTTGQTIPIAVSAAIQSAVTVSPSPLLVGQVKPGDVVTRTLLVRSSQPCKLKSVTTGKDELAAKFDPEPSRAVHTVTLTWKVPAQPGPFNSTVVIATDLENESPARVSAIANILP